MQSKHNPERHNKLLNRALLDCLVFSRRARWVIVPGVFSMQLGIRVLMGPTFIQFLICNLFWVPWNQVSGAFVWRLRTRRWMTQSERSQGKSDERLVQERA
jgi:hypothetical protein